MAGVFIGYRRSDSGLTTGRLQAKGPRWYSWLVPICISLLVQTASTNNASPRATSVVDQSHEHKRGELDDGCPGVPCPQLVVQLSEAQKSGRDANVAAVGTMRSALPQLVLPADVATKVGHKIWITETRGDRNAITSWNANEEFASLGIGHFIWFPAGKTAPFDESFPRMLEFLRQQNARLPSWLDRTPIPPCPWVSRTDFIKNFNSPQMTQLRKFLLDTVAEQTQFLVMRAQSAIDKILDSTPESNEREHIITQFTRIVQASKDLYPLIDYVNFKGEGTDPAETALDKETGERQGWGLKQVLLKMNGAANEPMAVLAEFADSAQFVLLQRIRNIPANRIWEAGWLRRVETYRRPISDPELTRKRTWNEPLHKRG